MTTQFVSRKDNSITFTEYGQLVLGCTESEIKKQFPENSITHLDDYRPNTSLLEIWVDIGTLTSVFNDNGICYMAFLLIDCLQSLELYINLCNTRYTILSENSWKSDTQCTELCRYGQDFYFIFYSVDNYQKPNIMKTKINLLPLQKHLSEVITPDELAKLLDELAYDYSRLIIRLQEIEDEATLHIHEEANSIHVNKRDLFTFIITFA